MSNILRRPWIETSIQQKLEKDIKGFETCDTDCPQIHVGNGKPVQVLDFLSPSVAHVSDSKSKIQAKIRSRNPAEPTQGSIITIKRCKLIFDPTSKKSDQLLLEIEDFKVLGSENSAPFGHPVDILKSATILKTLNQFRALMLRSEPHDTLLSQPTPPPHVEAHMSQGDSTPIETNTQQDFATQTLGLLSKRPHQSTTQVERARSSKDDLLKALFGAPKSQPPHENDVKADAMPPESVIDAVESPRKLSQVPHKEALLRTSKVEKLTNVQRNQSSQLSHSSVLENYQSPPKVTNINIEPVGDRTESEKENNQETLTQNHVSKSTSIVTPPAINETHNPFAGMTRVPRNLIRISHEQQELLDRKESWYDPNAGPQAVYATVPVKLREDLNNFIQKVPIASDPTNVSDDTDDGSESEGESHQSFHSTANNHYEQARTSFQDAVRTQFANSEEMGESDAENTSDDDSTSCATVSLGTHSANYGGSKHGDMTDEEDNSDDASEPSPAANRYRTLATLGETSPGLYQQSASEGNLDLGAAVNRTCASPTRVELQLATRRAPVPDCYPSSAPDQDLELDELHAEGDEVEHGKCEKLQLPQTSEVWPLTAPSKLRQIQVERSPFSNMNLNLQGDENAFSVSRPSSAKDIEVLHEAPSSDAVVVATYENISQETETIEAALNNEQHILGPRERDDSTTECLPSTHGIRSHGRMATDSRDSLESDEDIRSSPPPASNAAKPSVLLKPSIQPPSRKSKNYAIQPSILESISSRPVTPEVTCTLAESTILEKEIDAIPDPNLPASLPRRPTESVTNLPRVQTPLMTSAARRLAVEQAIQQEEFTRRNTKEMARAARRQFNEDCLAIIREPSRTNLHPLNTCPLPAEARLNTTQDTEHLTSPRQSLPILQEYELSQSQRTPPIQAMSQDGRSHGIERSKKAPSDQKQKTPKRASYSKSDRTSHNSASPNRGQDHSPVLDAHKQFLAAYPDYTGSKNNFAWALVYIEWLRKANQVLPGFLFDDFIRVISNEYIAYVHDCQQKDVRPLTGWHFYDERVDEPKFTESIIKRKNLSDALLSLDQGHVETIRAQFSATPKPDDTRVRGPGSLTNIQPVRQPSTSDVSSGKKRGSLPWRDTAPSATEEQPRPSKVNLLSSPSVIQNSPLYQKSSSAKAKASASMKSTPAQSTPTRLTQAQQMLSSPILGTESASKWRKAIENANQKEKRDRHESRNQVKTSDSHRSSSEASAVKRKPRHSTDNLPHLAKKPRVDKSSISSTNSLRTPSLTAPKSSSISEQSNTTSKVTGWLNKTKKGVTFKEILERRRQSGGFASRLSTPSSTPAKRFCTKPKQDVEVVEPKTQAWNYD